MRGGGFDLLTIIMMGYALGTYGWTATRRVSFGAQRPAARPDYYSAGSRQDVRAAGAQAKCARRHAISRHDTWRSTGGSGLQRQGDLLGRQPTWRWQCDGSEVQLVGWAA